MKDALLHNEFEMQYLALRQKEGRCYSDEEVVQLPFIRSSHPLHKEWTLRAASCRRLVNYLQGQRRPLAILEIGCGNGWLCHRLSAIPQATVTGSDVNSTELAQARRVFPQLRFLQGDLREGFTNETFDVIVFAASFQYFNDAEEILHRCFAQLWPGGEVHVLDTPFYTPAEAALARQRSAGYFSLSGSPGMQAHYFHHTWSSLQGFNYRVLHKPRKWFTRFSNPFPWLKIQP